MATMTAASSAGGEFEARLGAQQDGANKIAIDRLIGCMLDQTVWMDSDEQEKNRVERFGLLDETIKRESPESADFGTLYIYTADLG